MAKLKFITIIYLMLNSHLCRCLDTAGFYVKNATSQALMVISKSDLVKFTNGKPEQNEVVVKASDTTSFRLVFKHCKIPYPQTIEVRDQSTLLFSISITVDNGEPTLKIVDSESAVKKGLYVPAMGGGYNFVLAVGDDPLSLATKTQPGGVLPYPQSIVKPSEDSIEIVF